MTYFPIAAADERRLQDTQPTEQPTELLASAARLMPPTCPTSNASTTKPALEVQGQAEPVKHVFKHGGPEVLCGLYQNAKRVEHFAFCQKSSVSSSLQVLKSLSLTF